MNERAHIFFPQKTLEALDKAAKADRQTRSAAVQLAVEQYLAQRESVTGTSRLADLERLATSSLSRLNEGAPMPPDSALTGPKQGQIPEKDPNPASRSGPATTTHGTTNGYPGSRSTPGNGPAKVGK